MGALKGPAGGTLGLFDNWSFFFFFFFLSVVLFVQVHKVGNR